MTETKTTFTDLGLCQALLDALTAVGYQHPTPIQEQAIPHILMGRDVVGIAQTGTGKTASFTLPLIEILQTGRAKARMPRALILAPTRELAAQILENFTLYGKKTSLTTCLIVGGDSMKDQMALLQRGVDVLIATPGRFMDVFERGGLLLTDIKIFVIDEADRMLDMGFIPDIEKIAKTLPPLRQTLMFTATMPPAIRKLADQFLQRPKEVSVARVSSTNQSIKQQIYHTTDSKKSYDLLHFIQTQKPNSALIFCNRKMDVDKVKRFLSSKGLNAEAMHGDMVQSKRYEALDRFKRGDVNIFICSDIAARGIDIDDITHVYNYDVPRNPEDYVHRIGRTGRAGKTGETLMFVTENDEKNLGYIEGLIQQKLPVIESIQVGTPKIEVVKKEEPVKTPSLPRSSKNAALDTSGVKKAPVKDIDDTNSDAIGFGDDVPAFMRPFS